MAPTPHQSIRPLSRFPRVKIISPRPNPHPSNPHIHLLLLYHRFRPSRHRSLPREIISGTVLTSPTTSPASSLTNSPPYPTTTQKKMMLHLKAFKGGAWSNKYLDRTGRQAIHVPPTIDIRVNPRRERLLEVIKELVTPHNNAKAFKSCQMYRWADIWK